MIFRQKHAVTVVQVSDSFTWISESYLNFTLSRWDVWLIRVDQIELLGSCLKERAFWSLHTMLSDTHLLFYGSSSSVVQDGGIFKHDANWAKPTFEVHQQFPFGASLQQRASDKLTCVDIDRLVLFDRIVPMLLLHLSLGNVRFWSLLSAIV